MNQDVIDKTADYIKNKLNGESSGHDWWHIYRVWETGKNIAISEGANLYVVELACLLHDIADYKFHGGDEEIGPRLAGEWLQKLSVETPIITHVVNIISTSSFKGARAENRINTLEGQCVQDADRLDAIGAIGIARCFAYGGAKGNVIYDPSIPIKIDMSEEEYKRADHTQINHFYEKLLLLKDRMNTQTGKRMAEERHNFLVRYLEQFHKEWSGEI
ncbi:MAG: HD domain-containing protein [Nanoarchaeota archaeon]